jgi:uncharacterized protein (UPF0261 family)
MGKSVVMIGAFDSKSAEFAYLRRILLNRGMSVVTVDTGVMEHASPFPIDVPADAVAVAGSGDIQSLRKNKDRGEAMKVMARGAPVVAKRLLDEGRLDGIIGMGGTAGTTVATAAMRALPIGVPKVCVSTAASGNTAGYVGTKDVVLVPSIVDVSGVNRISRTIIARAAGAVCGMIETPVPAGDAGADKPIIAASMFGNTTACVDACREMLADRGYEVLVFHATGTGGRAMEALVAEGLVDAVLDITTTEWADEICGGVFDAGPERLDAPGKLGVPHLIAPGCVDMCNFGPPDTVPTKYAGRKFYEWNPSVTLMRTNVEENSRMGEVFAQKANAAKGPVAFLIPLRGVSILDGDGQAFEDRAADAAMFDAIKRNIRPGIPVVELDCNINDRAFAERAVAMMLELLAQRSTA